MLAATTMGDRANYAIVHRGTFKVFYAHWGGPTVPRELAAGPLACERFIRAQRREPGRRLLEFAFMEGGIALDKDTRRALAFGGPGVVNYRPEVQARLLERVGPRWSAAGWSLTWARRYAYDFVAFLGLDGARIETDYHSRWPASWDDVIVADPHPGCWLARRVGDGWELRTAAVSVGALVHHGLRLVDEFSALQPARELSAEARSDCGALLLDEAARRLVIVAPLFAGLDAPHHAARRARAAFPGWEVELELDLDPVVDRLAARGLPRATSTAAPDPDSAPLAPAEIDELLDRVLAYRPEAQIEALTRSAQELVDDVVAAADERGETVIVEHNMPGPPAPRRRRRPPWHATPRGRRSRWRRR